MTFIATALPSPESSSELPSDRRIAAPASGIVIVPPAGMRTVGPADPVAGVDDAPRRGTDERLGATDLARQTSP